MLKFLLVFVSYSSLVYFRRIFFLFPTETSKDLDYTKSDYGNIVSIYSICYTASKLILGSMNDVITPAKVLAMSVGAVSCALLGLSQASSTKELFIWIPMTALFQGGAWLAAVKFLKENYSSQRFTILFTVMSCTNNVSGMLASVITIKPWREMCWYCGLYGLLLAGAVYTYLRKEETPSQTPSKQTKKTASNKSIFIQALLSLVTWKIAIFLFFAVEVRSVYEMWAPVYLSELKKDNVNFKECSFLFEMGGVIGGFLSGVIVQFLEQRYGKDASRWNVASLCTGIMFISTCNFFLPDRNQTFNSFIIGATTYACINLYGMLSADAAPIHMSASVSAVVSFLSNLGPIATGSPLATYIENNGFTSLIDIFQIQLYIFILLIFITWRFPLHIQ